MKKLITFVFLFSFFAAGIVWAQAAQTPTASSSNTSQTTTSTAGQSSSTNSQTASTSTAQGQAQTSNGTYAGVSQAGMNALGGRKSSELSPAEWNALSEKDRTAILAEERIQDVMKQEDVSREEAQKLIGEHDQTVAENIAANKVGKACNKGGSNFTKYLLSYVGSGGGNFCWFCPMFEGLFDAMNNLATAISVKMAKIFLMILGVGLLFSIAFKVAKMVVSLQGADLMQFLTDMFKHLGRAIIATALLVSSLSIFTYLVSPVLTMSMSLSSVIMDEGGGRGAVIKATQATGIKAGSICDDLADQMRVTTTVEKQTKAFTPEVKASFLCALRTMSAGLIFGIILGVVIYSLAFTNLIGGLFPNIMYAILGFIIAFGHLAILITFPFKLIDSMIRMAFVTALMPLWIILWVFPATVGYTKKAWDLFLSSCLIFICLSVVITLVMSIMQYAIPNREEIIGLLTCGFDVEAADKIPIGGRELLVTAALTFLGWKMLGTATTLASSFVGAIPDLGIGQSINETTVKGAKLAGKGGRALGRKVANSKAGQWADRRLGLNSRSAAKLGTLAATGVVTAGWAPAIYGAAKGGIAGYRALRNKFGGNGGGTDGVQDNKKAPNIPPQGDKKVPNVPPQGDKKAPNVPPQGDKKVPNIPPQGDKKAPNVPSPKGEAAPVFTWSSGNGTKSETMSFNADGQPTGGMPTTAGTSSTTGGKPVEPMSYNIGKNAGGVTSATSISSGAGTPSETMSFSVGTPMSDSTQTTSISSSSGAGTSSETMSYGAGTSEASTKTPEADTVQDSSDTPSTEAPLNGRDETAQDDSSKDKTERGKEGTVDQSARDAARRAAAEAQRAAMQAAAAQAAAAQAMSEASKKDKDDDKKNKPE